MGSTPSRSASRNGGYVSPRAVPTKVKVAPGPAGGDGVGGASVSMGGSFKKKKSGPKDGNLAHQSLDIIDSSHTGPGSRRRSSSLKAQISPALIAKLSSKAKRHLAAQRGMAGHLAPIATMQAYFNEYATENEQKIKKLTAKDFKVCCGLLELEHSEADVAKIFDVCQNHNVLDLEGFIKAVQRGDFLKHVLVEKTIIHPYKIPKHFDWTKSTSDNYNTGQAGKFVGAFTKIRKTMDYSYHAIYPAERQRWQDEVIKSVVVKTKAQMQPWIVYTCGPMGAGKGYALSWMSSNGFFPLEGIVHIDPDHFKGVMTEWDGYVEKGRENENIQAGTNCHRESGFMQEIAQEVALAANQNIWVDGSLKDGKWFTQVFMNLRKRYPAYRIGIFYVYASEEIIRKRIRSREEQTGRGVPEAELMSSLNAPDRSLGMLMPLVDFVARINNNHPEPVLDAFETVDRSGAWVNIARRFAHTQPAPSDFPTKLAPLFVDKVATFPYDAFDLTPHVMSEITDYSRATGGTVVTVKAEVLQLKAMSHRNTVIDDLETVFSPAFPVNTDIETRRLAMIPGPAFSFVFCYGVKNFSAIEGVEDMLEDIHTFFLNGGFIFFDLLHRIVGVNMIQDPRISSAHMIHFGPCTILNTGAARKMRARHQPHLHEVTLPFMLDAGATHYAWVPPGETFGSGVQNVQGGFCYLFSPDSDHKDRIFPLIPG